MAAPLSPVETARAFLNDIGSKASELPDPFLEAAKERIGGLPVPARLTGSLGQLVENDAKLTADFRKREADLVQESISHRAFNTTGLDAKKQELRRAENSKRSDLREQWYRALPHGEKPAFDDLCLAIVEPVIGSSFPEHIPPNLRGPLARLALEHAAIARRWDGERDAVTKSLAGRGLGNQTIVSSFLEGIERDQNLAAERLIHRWMSELSPEQCAALEGRDQMVPVGGPEMVSLEAVTTRETAEAETPHHPTDFSEVERTVRTPLSASAIAVKINQPISRVESFLRRLREKMPDCCVKSGPPPRYIYWSNEVWPHLERQLPAWRAKLASDDPSP